MKYFRMWSKMMETLENNYTKNQLLDILSYLLWNEKAKDTFGPSSAMFCVDLYKDIAAEMKERITKIQDPRLSFEDIDMKCRYSGEAYALGKDLSYQ